MEEIKRALRQYMQDWIEAHAEAGTFGWSDYWYDEKLAMRMGDAAYSVFMATREAQDFARQQEKK